MESYPILDYALPEVLKSSKIQEALKGKEIETLIYVPGNIINIVTKKE